MYPFNQTLILLILSLLLCQYVVGTIPLFSVCSTSKQFTSSSDSEKNLNQLLSRLAKLSQRQAPGFAVFSVGRDSKKFNGLALCRGDTDSNKCRTCVSDANKQIQQVCPLKKEAIIYLDECYVRYSDIEFFGKIDNNHTFTLTNLLSVSSVLPPEQFNPQVTQLMNSLKGNAYSSTSFYAAGMRKLDSTTESLYGLVQCSQDLSPGHCKTCLESFISVLHLGRRGARVVGGSCSVRYEMYPFFASAQ